MDYSAFTSKLKETKIAGSYPAETTTELIRQLNETIPAYPTKLYKYRQCDELSISSFINDLIWVSKSSNFNDPHDTLLYFNNFMVNTSIRSLISYDKITEIKGLVHAYDFDSSETSKSLLSNYDPELIDLFRTRDLDSLVNLFNAIADSNISSMAEVLKGAKNYVKDSTYVSCFSSDITSSLMWAHYASSSTGFAIEYNFLDGIYSNNDDSPIFDIVNKPVLYPVIYSDKRFDATDYAFDLLKSTIRSKAGLHDTFEATDTLTQFKCALHKSVDWQYEKEWRIISTKKDSDVISPPGITIIKNPAAIFLGSNISPTYKKILINLAIEKNIPIFQMFLDDTSREYQLDYVSIV